MVLRPLSGRWLSDQRHGDIQGSDGVGLNNGIQLSSTESGNPVLTPEAGDNETYNESEGPGPTAVRSESSMTKTTDMRLKSKGTVRWVIYISSWIDGEKKCNNGVDDEGKDKCRSGYEVDTPVRSATGTASATTVLIMAPAIELPSPMR
ncbi:hypothetical protein E4U43_007605 [Claviceps pusilla]|uniref:Uncharacterized protein n=1 Tax=Claviceps pusilla TaxID=123648 RepID=A0A9P7NCR9_9HYPO|nr:hypothetical protein E4U43_007605 [Claviceps pusilla]